MKNIYYAIKRFFDRISDIPRELKWFYQRGKKGYSDRDCWSFDNYLAEVIAGGLKELAKHSHGCPDDFYKEYADEDGCQKWIDFLNKVANGFEEYNKDSLDELYKDRKLIMEKGPFRFKFEPEVTEKDWEEFAIKEKEKAKRFEENFQLFIKYFGAYWD